MKTTIDKLYFENVKEYGKKATHVENIGDILYSYKPDMSERGIFPFSSLRLNLRI